MPKTTPEEIIRHKELLRHYQSQIYKLTRQQKYLLTQLEKTKAQIKDYEREKKKVEKWLEANRQSCLQFKC